MASGTGGQHGSHESVTRERRLSWVVAIGVAYFLAHQVAFLFPDAEAILMAVWPAGGIGLAALLLSPRRLWPALAGLMFVAGNLANLVAGRPLLGSLGFMTANILESLGCAWLILRGCGEGTTFGRVREVVALLVAAVFVNAGTSLIGAGTAHLVSAAPFWSFWRTWWIADGMGILLVAPLLVSWARGRQPVSGGDWMRVLEACAFLALWSVLAWISFNPGVLPSMVVLPPYLLVALLSWPALRFGPRGATLAVALLAVVAVTSTVVRVGPLLWGGEEATQRLLLVQLYVAVVAVSGLLLAASGSEARAATREAREDAARVRALGDNLPDGMVYQVVRELDGSMRFLYLSAGVERLSGTPAEEVLTQPSVLYDAVLEEDRAIVAAAEQASARDMTPFSVVVRTHSPRGQVRWMHFASTPRRLADGRILWDGVQLDVTERKRAADRLVKVNACLLGLGPDFDANVARLTALCGELLEGTCALYNRLEGGMLCSIGQWHTPPDYVPRDQPEGHLCHDVIRRGGGEALVVNGLARTPYAASDPNVTRYGLKTYVGHVVCCAGEPVGSLCVVFQEDVEPTEDDKRILGIVASALSVEESRRAAEDALRDSEEKFARVFHDAPVLIAITDLDSAVYLDVNEEALRVSGYTRDEVLGHTAVELGWLAAEDRERFVGALRDHGSIVGLEVTCRTRHGRRLEGLVSGGYIEIGRRPCLLTVTTDVTELRRVEEALRESELRRRLAQEAAQAGTWEWNLLTSENSWSDEVWQLYGLDSGSCVPSYETWLQVVHPDDRDSTVRTVHEAVSRGAELNAEWRVPHGNGEIRWVMSRGKPFRDAEGRVVRYAGIVIDITDRKKAEAELAVSEERYRTLFEEAPIGIAFLGAEREIMLTNQRYRDFLGLSHAEIVERGPKGILHPDDWAPSVALSERLRSGEIPLFHMEQRYLRGDGTVVWADTHLTAVRDQDGRLVHTIGWVQDITERKQAEEERARLHNQLIQAQKMESVGRLAGGVAHDFNNMLSVILGRAEIAVGQVDPGHPVRCALEEILKAARRSADLTSQLLTFARKQTVAPRVLDLNETVAGMLQMMRRLLGEHIDLVWNPGAEVWPVLMDPSQVDQALANLCVNARDAIADVGRITIGTGSSVIDPDACSDHPGFVPGEYTWLAVTDNGCGMDRGTLAHVFEPFFTTKEVGRGTGLGLATVYGVVKQSGGFIYADSTPGQGSTFTIYLPRHGGKAGERLAEVAAAPAERGLETILLVEDEPAILELIQLILGGLGYTVLAAGAPIEAIRLAREHAGEIHLLLTDVVMPEMNGRDLARDLLVLHPQIKRLFMSGYTSDLIAHHGVLEEGVHFIQKPFSVAGLSARVRQVLEPDAEGPRVSLAERVTGGHAARS